MNRRKFLKRIAAVAAGSVVVLTITKRLPFKPNSAQQLIVGKHDRYCEWPGRRHAMYWDEFESMVSRQGRYKESFMKAMKGEYYANNRKNDLHYQTRH